MERIEKALCEEIYDARECGEAYCGVLSAEGMAIAELAIQFDLMPDLEIYKEIDRKKAKLVAIRILHRDLAYDVEIMSETKAESLANRFLAIFEHEQPHFYTNGTYYEEGSAHGWHPATSATFDTGILILGKARSGCLWVTDED